ncbi:hypothetical protein ASE74_10145 [Pedobacter sp. Leaf216]|nr:hypothetical protein ASE74_10145 [Pedobacter sp. Leaf216]
MNPQTPIFPLSYNRIPFPTSIWADSSNFFGTDVSFNYLQFLSYKRAINIKVCPELSCTGTKYEFKQINLMIFLSALPDTDYFMWQLEIQILNFKSFNIIKENYHILISYDPDKGINPHFKDLTDQYSDDVSFFYYADNRIEKSYVSTVRPHIIAKHFKEHLWLSVEHIFYHDTDIVFTDSIPDFDFLCIGDTWYFSDTRSYLDSAYIDRCAPGLLTGMCEVLGFKEELIRKNDQNAGGAQTLLKNVDSKFWEKIEIDCNILYQFLTSTQNKYERLYYQKYKNQGRKYTPISSWCSDMWVILWNALERAEVKLHEDLDFCWPFHDQTEWLNKKIFHNAGVGPTEAKTLFFKGNYAETVPYGKYLDYVQHNTCSNKYVDMIRQCAQDKIYQCSDVTFIIPLRIESEDRLENASTILRYLRKNFNAKILVVEGDRYRKLTDFFIPEGVDYVFKKDSNPLFYRELYNNWMVLEAGTTLVIKYDCDVVIPADQIYRAVIEVRKGILQVCYPYDGNFINVRGALKKYFVEKLDLAPLHKYLGDFQTAMPSFGGCCVLDRQAFINMGLDNPRFVGWGFEDQEINKRARILGYNLGRIKGPLFHLHHKRGLNSHFADEKETLNSYNEYIKVSNMEKDRLESYILEWDEELI